ncbi:DUF1622 domain-containing protein [Myxosarcina sp. GI1]|uniref:DUF1622 domain-containing protein n=1 Tax=Myxosarcina sp. GI1 TaxID=1541065 RepID=UPI00068FA95C|nr:DUF1622 domain-containing protein [Myxosarcina sp. GI1]
MENLVPTLYGWGIILSQLLALLCIVVGIAKGFVIYAQNVFFIAGAATAFQSSRLAMGYSFSLGLSFLIGSSILKTAIAPDWNDIAQLAAIIALRTVINFLLLRAIDVGNSTIQQSQ